MVREIAEELGFGLESLVFLDDNPIERDWVRRALPAVLVPELPRDPALRPACIASLDAFDRLALTDADVQRERSRATARERDAHARTATDYDEFLTSLGQQIEIARVQPSTLPRAAQLCERTNQFTLGTHRYTAGELAAMAADPDVELCTAQVRDRFEDSGITALTIVGFAGGTAEVHGWMLSCRVLGRRIEDGLLAFIARRAIARGATELRVPYVATTRNGGVKAFLLRRGFVEEDSVFRLPLGVDAPVAEWPAHVTLQGEFAS
jgi:FkbH-like protein